MTWERESKSGEYLTALFVYIRFSEWGTIYSSLLFHRVLWYKLVFVFVVHVMFSIFARTTGISFLSNITFQLVFAGHTCGCIFVMSAKMYRTTMCSCILRFNYPRKQLQIGVQTDIWPRVNY